MSTNTLPDTTLSLGSFLRDRRARLSPAADAQGRRRTPGLRREEVAARAGVSVTWYTWLEQGRGGPPSDDVLERLARALELDTIGREMLFLLAQQRPPPITRAPTSPVPPSLQRVLDSMRTCPAIVKTPTWDVVAWNAAALAVMGDYSALAPHERNVLRLLFRESKREHIPDWEMNARFAIGVFRTDVARVGGSAEADALAAELQATSAEFRRLWSKNEVRSQWVGHKRFKHPELGVVTLETTGFAVDGADGLTMVVFAPQTPADERAIAALVASRAGG